jgi:glyoxylase-like metal-dependent hydrolase (beta-lactamase superfamily II)
MKFSRRQFVTASSLAAIGGSLARVPVFGQQPPSAPATPPPPVVPTFAELRRNVGTFMARGGCIGWLITPEAVVVVDSQFADTAQMFLDGLRPRSSRKIDLLINSHHHGDHTGGNKTLRPHVVKIVAHANVPELQRKQAAANKSEEAQAYADETYSTTWKADVGSEVISTKYYGPGHTSGDSTIVFERANVVHMGDLMFNHRHPRVDRPGGASIRNWITLLEATTKDHGADTLYIFGHAKVGMPITGSRADLLAFRDYFTGVLDYVQKGIAAGRSVEEIAKVAQVPGFPQHEGMPTGTLTMAYEELTAKT